MISKNFALNHIISPNLNLEKFFILSNKLKIKFIEIRNDLPKIDLSKIEPAYVKDLTIKHGIELISINALQKFNIWDRKREKELLYLCDFAKKCDVKAIVLVPLNTGEFTEKNERVNLLNNSLKKINLILNDFNLLGYIEPLGFATSSLRYKSEVAKIINNSLSCSSLRILHDTFHHELAEEKQVFSNLTGLVHISGISNNKIQKVNMRDNDRELIDANDVLNNLDQIIKLKKNGYEGLFSFEPFSKKIQNLSNSHEEILKSIDYIKNNF